MLSRTNMKLAVMREHTQYLEKREQQQQQQMASSAPTSSAAIQVPLHSPPTPAPVPVQVPRQVLRVQTRLENPTRFHLQERQKRQVRQFLNDSSQNTAESPPNNVSTVQTISASTSNYLNPPSPLLQTQNNNATSTPELDEFWNDFRTLEASMESDVNLLEPTLTLPNTLPGTTSNTTLLNLYPVSQNGDQTSVSCPADLPQDGDSVCGLDIRALVKDRQKKDNHNMIERRRRFNINDRIKELGTLLPRNHDQNQSQQMRRLLSNQRQQFSNVIRDQRQNKGTILRASVEYLKVMKKEIGKIPMMEEKQRLLELENKKLLLRIQNLENQLQSNGIPLSETTWQPLSENDLTSLIKQESLRLSLNSSCLSSGVHCGSSNSCSSTSTVGHLKVKRELCTSPSPSISSGLSSAPSASPAPPLSHYDDFMMDDETPVNGDPMLSSHHLTDEPLSPDDMDFLV